MGKDFKVNMFAVQMFVTIFKIGQYIVVLLIKLTSSHKKNGLIIAYKYTHFYNIEHIHSHIGTIETILYQFV